MPQRLFLKALPPELRTPDRLCRRPLQPEVLQANQSGSGHRYRQCAHVDMNKTAG